MIFGLPGSRRMCGRAPTALHGKDSAVEVTILRSVIKRSVILAI